MERNPMEHMYKALSPIQKAAKRLCELLPEEQRTLSDESYHFFHFETEDFATVQRTLKYAWNLMDWSWRTREGPIYINDLVCELELEKEEKRFQADDSLMNKVNAKHFYMDKAPLVVYIRDSAIKNATAEQKALCARVLNAYVTYCSKKHAEQLDEEEKKGGPYQEEHSFCNKLFFVSFGKQCPIPDQLRIFMATISYPALTQEDMHQLLLEYTLRAEKVYKPEEVQKSIAALEKKNVFSRIDEWYANRMAGLEEYEARRLLNMMNAYFSNGCADYTRTDNVEKAIIDYKNKTLLQHDRLKLIEADKEVVGLDNIKAWLEKNKEVIGDYEDSPTGILLVGIPGTGKSATAKTAARQLNLPLVQLDMSKILGGRVGDSEKGMREMLEDLKFVAPCVLWIDEIEKAMSGADGKSGDGGVMQRLFGMLLTFIQENKRPVFTVATANDISKLPPEFFRNGRFDQTFCLMMPSYAECCKIMQIKLSIYFKKLGWEEKCDDKFAEKLLAPCLGTAAAPRFLTGADIEAHAKEFYWRCRGFVRRPLDDKLVDEMTEVAKEVRTQATPAAAHTMEDIAKRYVFMMRRGMTMAGEGSIYTPDRLDLDKVLYYSFDDDAEPKGLPLCMKEPKGYKEKSTGKSPKEWYDARFFYELTKAMSKVVATDKELAFDETLREYIKLQRYLLKNSPKSTE